MQVMLTQDDVDLIEKMVHREIANKLKKSLDLGKGQSLEGDFISLIVLQVVLPILVSLASSGLYDLLKGKALGSLRKDEIKSIKSKIIDKEINIKNPIAPDCLQELKTQLMPFGFTEIEIVEIYEDAKKILS